MFNATRKILATLSPYIQSSDIINTVNRQYFSTFITGFEKVVGEALVSNLNNVKIDLLLDGLVLYSTDSSVEKVKKLKFLNNTFLLFEYFENLLNRPMSVMMNCVLSKTDFKSAPNINVSKKYKTFRIITSEENQLVSVDNTKISRLEEKIKKGTRLKPNRSKPDVEFWFLSRNEGCGFFGMRLTKHPDFTKSLPKGELRPELAHILCLISEPKPADVFLDPFAGYGAIPHARTNYPYKQIIAFDNDPRLVSKLKHRLKNKSSVLVGRCDAIKLEMLDDDSVDKIVTDPPWGHFLGKNLDLRDFYAQMLDSFHGVLKQGSFAVILMGEKELFEELLDRFSDRFTLLKKLDTLVSGRKAGVYKMVKG